MKKSISLILAFAIIVGVFAIAPLAPKANATSFDGLKFELNDDGESYCVSGYTESVSVELVIPSTYNDLPVTSIGSHAFEDCIALTSVIIGDSVTTIGDYAFNSCVALTSVTIEDGVTTIGECAFYYCILITSISIPDSVTSIGESAFGYCYDLKNVTLGNGITSLSNLIFADCTSLTSITIPDSVTTIGAGAFYECTKLTNIIIPDKVTSIGEAAFYYCRDLISVTIPDSITSIETDAFGACSEELVFIVNNNDYAIDYLNKNNLKYILNSASDSVLEFIYNDDRKSYYVNRCEWGVKGKVVIPATYNGLPVLGIGPRAFSGQNTITSVIIPDGIKTIGESAFENCTSLTSINIPDSVTTIDIYAFRGCTSLENITLGEGITNIGSDVFFNTPYYDDVDNWENDVLYIGNCLIRAKDTLSGKYEIKEGTTCIGGYAFAYCSGLVGVNIPESVTSICEGAFMDCGLLSDIEIPESVTNIGARAFYCCTALTKITLPENLTGIEPGTFQSCRTLSEITIPKNVTSIGYGAFSGCNELENITIPGNVLSIGDEVFIASGLESVTFEEGILSIGYGAFQGCPLTSVTFPKSLKSIGRMAFISCYSLANIIIPDTVTSIGEDAFTYSAYYEDESNWEYQMLYIGNHLIKVKSGYVGNYSIKDGVKTIAGSAFDDCAGLKTVMMPDSLVAIGTNAFNGCTALKSVTIPDSVKYVEAGAFDGCKSATTIKLGENVTTIGDHAFCGCSSFKEIIIPKSVKSIGYRAFLGCNLLETVNISDLTAWCKINFGNEEANPLINAGKLYLNGQLLTDLVIPNDLTALSPYTFFNCKQITSVTIPKGVAKIGFSAFGDCSSLKRVDITDFTAWCKIDFEDAEANPLLFAKNLYLNGKLLTEIIIPTVIKEVKKYSFINCDKITSVTIPDSVTDIDTEAFCSCESLTTIKLSKGLTYIGDGAFEECPLLKYVFYKGSADDWSEILVYGNELELNPKLIHYNATEHGHSLVGKLPSSESQEGLVEDICQICGYVNGTKKIVRVNDYITAVDTKNAVVDATTNTLLLDISACKDITEAIIEMDSYTLTTTPTSSYGFIGTGSKLQVADSTGTQVAEYTLVVRGDVNGDSVCDVLDCMLLELARHESNNVSLEGVYFAAGNLAEDNEINIDDVKAVVNKALA